MANYKCTQCDSTAYSKCVHRRSVFAGGVMQGLLGNIMEFKTRRRKADPESDKEPLTYVSVELLIDPALAKRSQKEQLKGFLKTLEEYKEQLPMALCDHEWILQDEQCDLGCCRQVGA